MIDGALQADEHIHLFVAALEVRSRVSNPRAIALLDAILAPMASLHATWRPLLLLISLPLPHC
jgi:hypothetical protein